MPHRSHSDVVSDASDMSRMLRQGSAQSGVDLFAAYGINLSQAANGVDAAALGRVVFLSVAGFSGPHFSGFIVLGTTESMLRRSNSTASSSSDWMAELGNQLLGRIKNRLLREGISIYRVPPAVMSGCGASLFHARAGEKPLALTDDEDAVFIWTESEPSFEASIALQPDADVLAEGEMILF